MFTLKNESGNTPQTHPMPYQPSTQTNPQLLATPTDPARVRSSWPQDSNWHGYHVNSWHGHHVSSHSAQSPGTCQSTMSRALPIQCLQPKRAFLSYDHTLQPCGPLWTHPECHGSSETNLRRSRQAFRKPHRVPTSQAEKARGLHDARPTLIATPGNRSATANSIHHSVTEK